MKVYIFISSIVMIFSLLSEANAQNYQKNNGPFIYYKKESVHHGGLKFD